MPHTHATIAGLLITVDGANGLVAEGSVPGNPETLAVAASTFSVGCELVDSTTGLRYLNIGTVAVPSWRNVQGSVNVPLVSSTIATTGNIDAFLIVPETGILESIDFSGSAALAASDSNYITFTVMNITAAGGGTTQMLAATDANTTKATGGSAIGLDVRRQLTLNATAANLVVARGDRIRVRAGMTGTLANTVTSPAYMLRFKATA